MKKAGTGRRGTRVDAVAHEDGIEKQPWLGGGLEGVITSRWACFVMGSLVRSLGAARPERKFTPGTRYDGLGAAGGVQGAGSVVWAVSEPFPGDKAFMTKN